ncbi:hypothetical protein KIN20_023996 [Parelaphostrongylus tenuis]|uniref:Uncharacterized protein n=1 Tax=Parelaphostrongylus tenuis TaxID=148309 RepID=A0AAD5MWF6_PARTN|nr:hypothetical protein KIN20_023996 [Parelaphostrongylus tenuis]
MKRAVEWTLKKCKRPLGRPPKLWADMFVIGANHLRTADGSELGFSEWASSTFTLLEEGPPPWMTFSVRQKRLESYAGTCASNEDNRTSIQVSNTVFHNLR